MPCDLTQLCARNPYRMLTPGETSMLLDCIKKHMHDGRIPRLALVSWLRDESHQRESRSAAHELVELARRGE